MGFELILYDNTLLGGEYEGYDIVAAMARIESKLDTLLEKKRPSKPRASKKVVYWDFFDAVWRDYPKRAGTNSKQKAFKAFKARSHESDDKNINMTMALGANQYALFCDATGKTGTEYVMQAATFFGPDKHYENDWTIPTETETVPKDNEEMWIWAAAKGYREAYTGESPADYRRVIKGLHNGQ